MTNNIFGVPLRTCSEFTIHLLENGWSCEEIASMNLPAAARTEDEWETLIIPFQIRE